MMMCRALSPRELQVLDLVGRAFSNKTTARTLGISPGTLKWHLRNIYSKLEVSSREHAVMKARAAALIPDVPVMTQFQP